MTPTWTVTVTSPAFTDGGPLPDRHAGAGAGGENRSPAIRWDPPPSAAKSLVVLAYDPDAPVGVFVHWVVYDLSADLPGLAEGVTADDLDRLRAKVGANDFGRTRYDGPNPPAGKPHRLFFKVVAVNGPLGATPPGATMEQVKEAIKGNVVAWGQLVATYTAKPPAG